MSETSYRSNKARFLISGCAASTGKRPEYIRAKVSSKTDRSRQVPTMVLCLRKVAFWMVVTNEKWSLSRSRCTWRCMKGLVSKETVLLRWRWSKIQ